MAIEDRDPDPLHPAPSLSQGNFELSPSPGLLSSILEVALEDPAYRRYSNLPSETPAHELDAVRKQRATAGDAAYWALLAGERQVSGIFELTFRDKTAGILEAGYWIIESARGRGYATQALVAVTAWVEQNSVGERIELAIYPENAASLRVAQKAGYVDRGPTTPSAPGAPRHEFPQLYVWDRLAKSSA